MNYQYKRVPQKVQEEPQIESVLPFEYCSYQFQLLSFKDGSKKLSVEDVAFFKLCTAIHNPPKDETMAVYRLIQGRLN